MTVASDLCPTCGHALVWTDRVRICCWKPCRFYGTTPRIGDAVLRAVRQDPEMRAALEQARERSS